MRNMSPLLGLRRSGNRLKLLKADTRMASRKGHSGRRSPCRPVHRRFLAVVLLDFWPAGFR
jgi:hypothetical protein